MTPDEEAIVAVAYEDAASRLEKMAESIVNAYEQAPVEMRELGKVRAEALREEAGKLREVAPQSARARLAAMLQAARQSGADAACEDAIVKAFESGGVDAGLSEFARSVKDALGPLWDPTVDGPSAADMVRQLRVEQENRNGSTRVRVIARDGTEFKAWAKLSPGRGKKTVHVLFDEKIRVTYHADTKDGYWTKAEEFYLDRHNFEINVWGQGESFPRDAFRLHPEDAARILAEGGG